jgi:hypothetical protein
MAQRVEVEGRFEELTDEKICTIVLIGGRCGVHSLEFTERIDIFLLAFFHADKNKVQHFVWSDIIK